MITFQRFPSPIERLRQPIDRRWKPLRLVAVFVALGSPTGCFLWFSLLNAIPAAVTASSRLFRAEFPRKPTSLGLLRTAQALSAAFLSCSDLYTLQIYLISYRI